jgi:hypothetical protein
MITIFDSLYGTTYRNITNILFRGITIFGVLKYRIDFWFNGGKDVIWFDPSPTRKHCYIQLGDEQYGYEEIKEDELKFKMKLNNELTKIVLEILE